MKESHRKDPASHPDPESCVEGREATGEALTGAHAGQPSRPARNARSPGWRRALGVSPRIPLAAPGGGAVGSYVCVVTLEGNAPSAS
jgi:hypothetical protein